VKIALGYRLLVESLCDSLVVCGSLLGMQTLAYYSIIWCLLLLLLPATI
jgi:hypothetical protein